MNGLVNTATADKIRMDLDECEISQLFTKKYPALGVRFHITESLGSTNDFVLQSFDKLDPMLVCVANEQTAGRGRNGRAWYSPENSNIYLSIGRQLKLRAGDSLSCLSMACGVALCRWLEEKGVKVELKWPNDILVDGRKLAGILIESKLRSGKIFLAIGVGVNIAMSEQDEQRIDQPWTDLKRVLPSAVDMLSKNQLVVEVVGVLAQACAEIERNGFEDFRQGWLEYDCLKCSEVTLQEATGESPVSIVGLADDCGLLVRMNGQQRTVYAADIKLKLNRYDSD